MMHIAGKRLLAVIAAKG